MASLIINRDGFKLDELELKHGELSIGRTDANDLALDDSTVSGTHCKIATFFNVSYIEDQKSTNGTYVNGQRVQKRTLRNGDVITLGSYQLMFKSAERTQVAEGSNETMMMNKADLDRLMEQSREVSADRQEGHAQASSNPSAAGVHAHKAPQTSTGQDGAIGQKPDIQVSSEEEQRILQFLRNRTQASGAVDTELSMAGDTDFRPTEPPVSRPAGRRTPVTRQPDYYQHTPAGEDEVMSPLAKVLLVVGAVVVMGLVLLIVQQI